MPSPSAEIIQLLSVFSVAFTVPIFAKVMVLIFGTILAPARHCYSDGQYRYNNSYKLPDGITKKLDHLPSINLEKHKSKNKQIFRELTSFPNPQSTPASPFLPSPDFRNTHS